MALDTAAKAPDFQQILGSWIDEQGSKYEVTLDKSGKTCSVQTLRPGGKRIKTEGLIATHDNEVCPAILEEKIGLGGFEEATLFVCCC